LESNSWVPKSKVLTHCDNYATVGSMLSSETSDAVPGQQLYLDEDHQNKLKHPCKHINTFLILRENIFTNNQQTCKLYHILNNALLTTKAKKINKTKYC